MTTFSSGLRTDCGRNRNIAQKPLDQKVSGGVPDLWIESFVINHSAEETFHHGATATMYVDWDEVEVTAIFGH